jgi:glycosyltransferase involved in cell wall biosynthesis
MKLLAKRGVRVFGLLVGDGPMRAQIENQIQSLGLTDRVGITGFVNQREMPLVLDAGDLLVSSSESDPHPLVVTESAAVGLPIVASSRIGCIGPTDTARPDVNTLVFSYGDVHAMADRIQRLVENAELRRQMSGESRKIAATQDVSATVEAVGKAIHYIDESRRDRNGHQLTSANI